MEVKTQNSHFKHFFFLELKYLESVREATVFTKLSDNLLKLSLLDFSTLFNPLVEHGDNGNPRVPNPRNPTVKRINWRRRGCQCFSGVEEDSENPRNPITTPWI